jgi:hypothetical protein
MHTVAVHDGPDGSVLRWPFPSPFPRHCIPLDGRRTERSWPVPSRECAPVNGRQTDNSEFLRKFSELRSKSYRSCPSHILSCICPLLPPHLPSCLKTVFSPFTDCLSSMPASHRSRSISVAFVVNTGFLAASSLFCAVLGLFVVNPGSPFFWWKGCSPCLGLSSSKYGRHPHFYWGWWSYFELDRRATHGVVHLLFHQCFERSLEREYWGGARRTVTW